jgi:hypothetical protein
MFLLQRLLTACVVPGGFALLAASATAQSSAADANKSNNPLNPAPGLNLQDYYAPDLIGSNAHTNDLLLRGTLPLPPMGFIPVPQLLRVTVPVSTRPDPDGGYTTGLGDINLFDIFLTKAGSMEVGVGPLVTASTAGEDELGTGKWQAGLAAVAIHPSTAGLFGGLVQWQHSFAGDSDRATTESLTIQPLGIYNLPDGWYLRSTATATFDLHNNGYYVPIGLGVGKVWKIGSTIMNCFVEPQWTVLQDQDGFPRFQAFLGINFTF